MNATIVIPQYGRFDLTRRCLSSIREEFPIVVVDDGSAEDPGDFSKSPESVTLALQPHRGVTAAWNAGLRCVATEFVVFLNNDVVADGPFVERLIAPLIDRQAWMTGVRMRTERLLPAELLRSLPTTRFLEGWCFALRTDLLLHLGGFDEWMRVYWSDADLQLRVVQLRVDEVTAETPPGPPLVRGRMDRVLMVVDELPLRHVGHATARGLVNRRALWRADREIFIRKWSFENANTRGRFQGHPKKIPGICE